MKRLDFLKLMAVVFYLPILLSGLKAQMHLDSEGSNKIIDQNSIQSPSECNCSEALDIILNYTKLLRMYDTETRTFANFFFNKNPSFFSIDKRNNREILHLVIQAMQDKIGEHNLKEICPSILKSYDGYKIRVTEFVGILGEPLQDPCFTNYIMRIITEKNKFFKNREMEKDKELKFLIKSSLVEDVNQSHKINYKLFKDHCQNKDYDNTLVELYDIPVFNNSRIDAIKYIANSKYLPIIEKRKCHKKEALDIVDQQSKFWNNLVISIDKAYDIIYSSEKDHPIRSFWIHQRSQFDELIKLMAFAAPILKTDGYLDKNIQVYKTECIPNNTPFKFNHPNDFNDFKELINSVHSKEILYNLKFSMDAIAPHAANIIRIKGYSLFPRQKKSNLFRGE